MRKEKGERKCKLTLEYQTREGDVMINLETQNKKGKRCTAEGLREKKSLAWQQWMSGCLTTTGSWLLVSSRWSQYPWKLSLRPLAPAALWMGKREGKGRVSDKGTVCSVGKNEAKGERMKRRRRRRRGAAAEWNRQASTPLVFSTSQSKATVCEKSILQSHSTHL